MIYFLILFILFISIAIYFSTRCTKSTLPIIFKYGSSNPTILILAGTHGNEQGPSHALTKFIKNKEIHSILQKGTYHIVPYVNSDAIKHNTRHTSCQPDINRSYPNKNEINRFLLKYINNASLIIDFHEARGFRICSNKQSLGQTISTNNKQLLPIISHVCATLNKIYTGCHRWTAIYMNNPDALKGSLEQYATHKKIPYILVETAGQNDIVPLNERITETKIILSEILKSVAT
ncbi:MAG: hypothetical protein Harvfovirus76_4 [Harvfovirus sp.]|uniref:Succinylglutamate desuccinylase/Aspartoacylase catalytic domain-containing protein n=1 Tax=Harvfovirus sp. TaxID=2487768 RepID=A0A3G5A3V3_9VIRU|nr:MAG: hypothetical protein Harvfovirus76_4 [Harvfovirus sp.]